MKKILNKIFSNNFFKEVTRNKDKNVLCVDRARVKQVLVMCFYVHLVSKKYNYNPIILSDSTDIKSINLFKKFGFNKFLVGFRYYLFFINTLMFLKSLILTIKTLYLIKKNGRDWFIYKFRFSNIKIGDLVHDYYIRFGNGYLKNTIDIKFINILFKTIFRTLNISKIIKNKNIKYIVVGTETYPHNDAIALRLGLNKKITVIEPSLLLGFIKHTKNSIANGKFNLSGNKGIRSMKDLSKIDKFLKKRFTGKIQTKYTGTHLLIKTNKKSKYITRSNFLKKNNFDNKKIKKIILFSCHALTDANHALGTNFLFLDYYNHLKETLEFVNQINNPNVLWVVRPNPTTFNPDEYKNIQFLVKKFNNKKIITAPKNMMSYNLTNICDNVITGRGTVGMEFACLGKYPITVGSSVYSRSGFCLEFSNKKKYFKQLENIEKIGKLSNDKKLLAKQFLYYLDNKWDPFIDENTSTIKEKKLHKSAKFIADWLLLAKNLNGDINNFDFKNNQFVNYLSEKI